ncbi:hypothetical protein H206_05462 [Candidatus Electrothrix aarhusensis]|uniref:Uncharacterized protein n=1 Tax=Candidatus Electrothrix aarhusensis TaxID=1859131 RepID=A0A3S3RU05_9BACT|nr:hypothetical protein H206_05462 [Candidatus Electrothrix aarhusensis]
MPVLFVMLLHHGHPLWNLTGQLQKNPHGTPRFLRGMIENNPIGHRSPKLLEQRSDPPPMHPPKTTTRYHRQHHLITEKLFPISIQQRHHRSTGIIRPGRASQDN